MDFYDDVPADKPAQRTATQMAEDQFRLEDALATMTGSLTRINTLMMQAALKGGLRQEHRVELSYLCQKIGSVATTKIPEPRDG